MRTGIFRRGLYFTLGAAFLIIRVDAVTLTSATILSTDVTGSEDGFQYWDTSTGPVNSVYDLWFTAGKPGGTPDGLTGAFINGPTDAAVPINFVLQLGDNSFTLFGAPGAVFDYHGLNLFFEGHNLPDISVKAPTRTGGAIPPFSANSGASTLTPDGGRAPGAGTLLFSDGSFAVTLIKFEWASPDVHSLNRVGPYAAVAQGGTDFIGTFTLNVSNASVPEGSVGIPVMLITLATLIGVGRVKGIHQRVAV
jgi:hypothetical protein